MSKAWAASSAMARYKVEEVAWSDLQEVSVITTDKGPFSEDVFFVLVGSEGRGCVVPQSATESAVLLERLQQLPGFDNRAFMAAMACTQNEMFVSWRRPTKSPSCARFLNPPRTTRLG
jgi:hypothetical protein